jgi:hypothetical protein
MKKLNLVCFILSLALFAHAQNHKTGIKFGARAGVNFSNMTAKSPGISVSFSSLTGFNAGGFVEIPAGDKFAIQPELAFSQMGAKFKVPDGEGGTFSGTSKLNYLTLPALVKFKVPNTGIGIYAGPQVGLLLSAKEEGYGESTDAKDNYNSSDFAGVFGGEYFFDAGIGISARYQLGLSNIAKDAGDNTVKNTAFTITVGYRF